MADLIEVSWAALKSSMISKSLQNRLQWMIEGSVYKIFLFDSPMDLSTTIKITNPKNASQHDFEVNYKDQANQMLNPPENVIVQESNPFNAKRLADGSRFFRRVHGTSAQVQNEVINIDFVVPYTICKITGVQILGGKLGDKANFKIMDTETGTLTGIPFTLLNQFGFNVNIVPEVATYPSKYDADLIGGLVLRMEYDAKDEALPRTVYINYDLHEVKK